MPPENAWDISADHQFHVDGVAFRSGYLPAGDGSFTIVKSGSMMDRYRPLYERFDEPRMVEIGIAYGGSVALLSLLARPSKFLALEISPDELPQLTDFIDQRGWRDRVRVRYGVDQADRELVLQHALDHFGDDPLDLVLDDASHLYGPTKASFETLFPLLRPGGLFVIEDWNCDHVPVWAVRSAAADPSSPAHEEALALLRRHGDDPVVGTVPLSRLALELVSARAESEGAVAKVTFDDQWITVERGPAVLDPRSFRLDDYAYDHYGQLAVLPA